MRRDAIFLFILVTAIILKLQISSHCIQFLTYHYPCEHKVSYSTFQYFFKSLFLQSDIHILQPQKPWTWFSLPLLRVWAQESSIIPENNDPLILPRIKLRKMSHSIQYTVYGWYFAWYLFNLKCSDCAALVRERGGLVLVRSHRHLKPSFRKTPQIPSPAPLNWSRAQRAPEKTISLIGDEKTNRFLWESVPIPNHTMMEGVIWLTPPPPSPSPRDLNIRASNEGLSEGS